MLCTAAAASAAAPWWLFVIILVVLLLIFIIFFICYTCIKRNKGDVYKGSLHHISSVRFAIFLQTKLR